MNRLAIVTVGAFPPNMDTVYAAWDAQAPSWFDELRAAGKVHCNMTGAELAERGINMPRLCDLLSIEDDAAGLTAGLRTGLDSSLAAIAAGDFGTDDFNHGLEHLVDCHELHVLHPDRLDRIMHQHGECDCGVVRAA